MAHGWEGRLVRLVPLDEDRHLDNAIRWLNDPEVTEWVKVGDFPLTALAERDWMRRSQGSGQDDVTFAIETREGVHIGFSGIDRIQWRHGYGTTGTIIGDKKSWGQGFGTDASKVRARYAFEVLGLRMLLSGYLAGNEASRIMNERVGYVEWGRVPALLWKRGAYRDLVRTCLTRQRWEQMNEKLGQTS